MTNGPRGAIPLVSTDDPDIVEKGISKPALLPGAGFAACGARSLREQGPTSG